MATPASPPSLSADDLCRAFASARAAQTEGRLDEAREQYLLLLG